MRFVPVSVRSVMIIGGFCFNLVCVPCGAFYVCWAFSLCFVCFVVRVGGRGDFVFVRLVLCRLLFWRWVVPGRGGGGVEGAGCLYVGWVSGPVCVGSVGGACTGFCFVAFDFCGTVAVGVWFSGGSGFSGL